MLVPESIAPPTCSATPDPVYLSAGAAYHAVAHPDLSAASITVVYLLCSAGAGVPIQSLILVDSPRAESTYHCIHCMIHASLSGLVSAGAGVHPVPHPGGPALLQRAWLRVNDALGDRPEAEPRLQR